MAEIDFSDEAAVQRQLDEMQESTDLIDVGIFLTQIPPIMSCAERVIAILTKIQHEYLDSDFKKQQFEQFMSPQLKQNLSLFFGAVALTAGATNYHKMIRTNAIRMLTDAAFEDLGQLAGYLRNNQCSSALITQLFSAFSKQTVQRFVEEHQTLSFETLLAISNCSNPPDFTSFKQHENTAFRRLAAARIENDEDLIVDAHYLVRSAACQTSTKLSLLVPRLLDKSVLVRKAAAQRLCELIAEEFDGEEIELQLMEKNCLVLLSQSEKTDFTTCLELVRIIIQHKLGKYQTLLQALISLLASASKTPYLNSSTKDRLTDFLLQFLNFETYNLIELYLIQPNGATIDVVVEQLMRKLAVSESDLIQLINLVISQHEHYQHAARILRLAAKSKPEVFLHQKIQQNLFTKLIEVVQQPVLNVDLIEVLSDALFYVHFNCSYLRNGEMPANDLFLKFSDSVLYNCQAILECPFKSLIRLYCLNNKARVDQLFGMMSRRAIKLTQQANYIQFCSVLAIFLNDFEQAQMQTRIDATSSKVDQIALASAVQAGDLAVFQEYSYIINACYAGLCILKQLGQAQQAQKAERLVIQLVSAICSFLAVFPPGLLVEGQDFQVFIVSELREQLKELANAQLEQFSVQAIKFLTAIILKSPAEFGALFDDVLLIFSGMAENAAVQQQMIFTVSNLVFSNSIKLGVNCAVVVDLAFSVDSRVRVYALTVLRQLGVSSVLQQQFGLILQRISIWTQQCPAEIAQQNRPISLQIVSFSVNDRYRQKMMEMAAVAPLDDEMRSAVLELIQDGSKQAEDEQP